MKKDKNLTKEKAEEIWYSRAMMVIAVESIISITIPQDIME